MKSRRPVCRETPAQRSRRYYLAYLSCGLTPAQARKIQRENIQRARRSLEAVS